MFSFTGWRRLVWVLLPLLSLVALVVLARPQPPPNIVLILIDTLRADRLGAYGNGRGLTPFLDQLAGGGTLFRHAYSTTSWTSPAVASLFTSRYPSQHRIVNYDSKLADDEVEVATRLQHAGYTTAAFVANSQISPPRGFAAGFGYWWDKHAARPRAAEVRSAVAAWLDGPGAGRRGPTFLYVHLLDPHSPYLPDEPYRSRFEEAAPGVRADRADAKMKRMKWSQLTDGEVRLLASRYDGAVASVDAQIGLLIADLRRRGFLEHAVIVVTADHGEEFMEHGGMDHGRTLHAELITVPLIVAAAGRPGGRTVRENVSLIDIAPTILELAGLSAEPRFEGRSLVPLLAEHPQAVADAPAPLIIAELLPNGSRLDLRRHTRAIISGSAKLLVSPSGQMEAFDLAADPRETQPNAPGSDQQAQRLMAALDDAEQRLATRVAVTGVAPLDEAAREKLRALGYDPPRAD